MKLQVSLGLIVLAAVALLAAGCVQPGPAATEAGAVPTEPWIAESSPVNNTAVLPAPSRDLAILRSDGLMMDPQTATIYEYTGTVEICEGVYKTVIPFLRYPDGTVFWYNVGGMGGSNMTKKEFFIYPDERYQSVTPGYYISLDGVNYTASYRYDNGSILRVATSDSRVTR